MLYYRDFTGSTILNSPKISIILWITIYYLSSKYGMYLGICLKNEALIFNVMAFKIYRRVQFLLNSSVISY